MHETRIAGGGSRRARGGEGVAAWHGMALLLLGCLMAWFPLLHMLLLVRPAGITTPKYQYVIDELANIQDEVSVGAAPAALDLGGGAYLFSDCADQRIHPVYVYDPI